MTKPMSRPAQFRQLLARAATELGLPRSHDTTQRLATVRLQRRAIREIQQIDLLSGKLSDPTKLLDADERLRLEEERLAPATAASVTLNILPVRLMPRPPEPTPPVVALSVPLPDAAVSEKRMGDDPPAKETTSKPKSNVVALDPIGKNKSRDFHAGQTALKTDIARDQFMGGFSQDPGARDPHPVDQTWPIPEPLK